MKSIKFRPVEKKDFAEVCILLNQLKEQEINLNDVELIWESFIKNTSNNSIVGIDENDFVVAYGSCVIENKIRGEVAGHIEDIVVDKKMRGRNVGVDLISELVKSAKKRGCYRITLFCRKELINFYSKNGFEVNNVVMKKYL
jgi:ribosomal protein S18 acetylase RimI-like enzyme